MDQSQKMGSENQFQKTQIIIQTTDASRISGREDTHELIDAVQSRDNFGQTQQKMLGNLEIAIVENVQSQNYKNLKKSSQAAASPRDWDAKYQDTSTK